MRQIGDRHQHVIKLGLNIRELELKCLETSGYRLRLGQHSGGILATRLERADLFGQRVALGLKIFCVGLHRLATDLKAIEGFHRESKATTG